MRDGYRLAGLGYSCFLILTLSNPHTLSPHHVQQSNDLLKHLPDAVFVAIDEEMTGIRSGRLSKDDTPADRYQHLKDVPERYSIIQVGICLFIKNLSYHEQNRASEYLVVR